MLLPYSALLLLGIPDGRAKRTHSRYDMVVELSTNKHTVFQVNFELRDAYDCVEKQGFARFNTELGGIVIVNGYIRAVESWQGRRFIKLSSQGVGVFPYMELCDEVIVFRALEGTRCSDFVWFPIFSHISAIPMMRRGGCGDDDDRRNISPYISMHMRSRHSI
ncbi:hypothetical protein CPB84DRAFT_1787038 [Gymnopilus junonius]|uniref:Uncharacterized protein n=1 Tax=Gymnopilus junonius TaxID=109634 RepID=A0A9P5NHT7_GYMJU|nr:hypothetical protein CPB84DRAFT_1787038 [Gymnopilus junonius]